MKPELCTGSVMHARFAAGQSPAAHRFVYPLFFLALPLSQLQDAGNRLFGIERARPLSLRFRDHGARDGSPPEPWIRRLLAAEGITTADGEVVLQTFPRIFGFVFNPVSFWFCHDRDGAPLREGQTVTASKAFHVSPFCEVEGGYRFRFFVERSCPVVRIDYDDAEGELLLTSVSGKATAWSTRALLGALLRMPLLTAGIVFRIHWQALRLWIKGVPFVGARSSHQQQPLQESAK